MTDAQLPENEKRMKLRYAGVCRLCGAELPAGADAIYERATKTVRCATCRTAPNGIDIVVGAMTTEPVMSDEAVVAPADPGPADVAGSSARREYERRKAKDEARIRARWGRLGGIAVALSDERQSTKAWQQGAIGEERLGARLGALAAEGFVVLHDRRIPGTRANIDHIVVGPNGVWIIDAKRYKGRPELRIEGGILRPRTEKLLIGGRDRTGLVDGVLKQVEHVRSVTPDLPIVGALCFVEADWPLIGGSFRTRDVKVLWPKLLLEQLRDSGPVDLDVKAVGSQIAARFGPA